MEALLAISGLLAAVGLGAVGIGYARASGNGPVSRVNSIIAPPAPGTPSPGTQIVSPFPSIVLGPDHIAAGITSNEVPASTDPGYHPAPPIAGTTPPPAAPVRTRTRITGVIAAGKKSLVVA